MKIWTTTLLLVASLGTSIAQDIAELNGKELFGGLKARHIGPALMSGRISDVQGHPEKNSIIYAGTAGGGVWKSTDGGVIFNPIFDEHCQSIGTIALDPKDPDNTIWIGTGEIWTRNSTSVGDGIYRTTNGGRSWNKMGLENSERISSIVFDPNDSKTMYVGVLGALWGESEERGVYKTTDGGITWEKIYYIDENTGCTELIMDPNNSSVLYASFWEHRRTAWSFSSGGDNSALYKSTDGGKSWNKIHNGIPNGKLGRMALAMAPSNSSILYASIETEDPNKSGMYRSDDAGNSWTHLNSDFGLVVRPFYFSRIVVHPTNPDFVVKAGLFGSLSRDGGKTFSSLGAMHADIHDIWFDIKDPDKMFVGTDGGLYRSLNQGGTMEMIENMPVCQFYHVAIDNQEPYNIYGGLQDNGSWFGPSRSPGGVEARDWEVIGVGDGFRVYPHPTKPNIMYSEMQGAEYVWRYDHAIRQTKSIQPSPQKGDPKLRYNWNAPITTSPNKPDRLYIGSQFVHISDDMGDTWKRISPDLTTNDPAKLNQEESGGLSVDNSGAENHCTIFTIAESPLDEKVIWVGTDDGNVQVTQDGGKSWVNITEGLLTSGVMPRNTWCHHIEASNFNKGTAYAVFDGHTRNDKKPYVFKTNDFGKTWTSLVTDEIYGFTRSIQEDLKNPEILYLGTEFGLYISITGGKSWMKFENNMPSTAVHYIEMHPKTHDLIMGTHGRGIIIIDDISPLREISNEVMSSKVQFLSMPTFYMSEESTFGGTSSEVQFVGSNPASGARIPYYMSKRHTFGKMTMEVQDMEGNYVTSLSPQKQKGLNFVSWDFNMSAPKIASGKTLARGGMFVPRVEAGTYKVVINKGKEKFETTINVEYPKNSMFTDADRKLHHETTMKLYKMNEDLAYIVYQIDEQKAFANNQVKSNPKLNKSAQKLITELDALKKDLVVTSGDNYVGRAENQFRENLGELYATIGSNFGPPTSSQLESVELMTTKLNEAMGRFDKIKMGTWKKFIASAKKLGTPDFKIQTYEEFVKKN